MQEYIAMWKNYTNFSGKSNLREFWMAILFNIIISFAVGFVFGLLKMPLMISLYSLAITIPALALQVRRLRDAGKNWTWIFINFVPFVGSIIYIVMLCKPSVEANIVDAA